MAAVFIQLVGEIDYGDCFEGAFFDADAASAAEFLGDGDFVFFEPYGFYAAAHHWAVFYAHLVAFFGFAFVVVHYCNAGHGSSRIRRQLMVINYDH